MSDVKLVIVDKGEVCKIEILKKDGSSETVTIDGVARMVINENSDQFYSMEQRCELLVAAVRGLKRSQWSRIIQNIEMMFSHQAAKVEIDDLDLLRENLKQEFRP